MRGFDCRGVWVRLEVFWPLPSDRGLAGGRVWSKYTQLVICGCLRIFKTQAVGELMWTPQRSPCAVPTHPRGGTWGPLFLFNQGRFGPRIARVRHRRDSAQLLDPPPVESGGESGILDMKWYTPHWRVWLQRAVGRRDSLGSLIVGEAPDAIDLMRPRNKPLIRMAPPLTLRVVCRGCNVRGCRTRETQWGACVRLDGNLRTPGLGPMICKNGPPVETPVVNVIIEREIKYPCGTQLAKGKGMGGPWSFGDREWGDFAWQFEHDKLPRRTPLRAYVAHVYVARPMKCSASAVLCVVNGGVNFRHGRLRL